MSKPKPTLRTRRRRSRCAEVRAARGRRPLRVESLEERNLLAADLGLLGALAEGEGRDPLLAIRLDAVDPQTFQPLNAVHQGEEFVLLASVEDLRPEALGVYAAYLDVLLPADFFTVPSDAGEAAIIYGSDFGNGTTGEVSNGLVDELGTFAASTVPTGAGQLPLAGIRLVATQTGEVRISSNAADESPAHDSLLFDRDDPVPTDLVVYGDLTLQILAPLPGKPVDAIADFLVVNEGSTENLVPVMKNDKNTTGSPLVITAVDTTNSHGDVAIANGGTLLVYTPDPGFVGTDLFAYTVMANGEEDTANVRVEVKRLVTTEDRVAFNLEVTDHAGKRVSAVTVGDDFVLHVAAEDLRGVPLGVFAAYMDLLYTSAAVEVAGPVTYGPAYPNDHVGDASVPGEIDEVGAFSNPSPLGGGAFEVFQIPFHATAPGPVVFEADPADNDPTSQTLLFDVDEAIAIDEIRFGRVTLIVLPAVVAVDDTYEVTASGAQSFAVLENDVNRGAGALTVVAVDDSGLLGTVAVAPNGSGVVYTPPSDFGGSEQFTYTASGPAGSSKAEVTVHLQPTASLNDQLGIRLATTDLDGHEISSVAAGQEFLVQAHVQDLREPGVDRGVYAAYFDLLYDRVGVRPVQSKVGQIGPVIELGTDYLNGAHHDASVPGILNEVGAFQTGTTPLGSAESLLFAARFRAVSARGKADLLQIFEDAEATLSVLENDLPNLGMTRFQADPADESPFSDALFYDPVEPLPYGRIGYGNATIEITPGAGVAIASVSAGSSGGSISIADGGVSLLYSPAPNFNGVETFTYSLDGDSQIPVSVTVLPVNDVPVAVSDIYRVRENRVLDVVASAGVAANDVDYDGDTLAVQLVSGTSHGTLQLEANGAFTYTPDENFLGLDSFTYRVTDGQVESAVTTVRIDVVPRPVSIRLEAVNASGDAVSDLVAGESVVVRTLVQDLRSPSDAELGIGAVYLDIVYEPDAIAPATATDGPLGLDIQFGAAYTNGIGGEALPAGRLNDIGAFQTDLQPIGADEVELFRLAFESSGPRAVDDLYIVAGGTSINRLNILKNDAELQWDIVIDAQHAANSPNADVLYLDPAEPIPEDDIRYGDITLAVRNGELTIQSVGDASSGAKVSIATNGAIIYEPVAGFTGDDSFTYTVIDARGSAATATVTIAVAKSWQNLAQPTDVNGDGSDSPLDALVIINELNTSGPHLLTDQIINAFLDVNGDGNVSPIDVLLVVNRLLLKASSGEGEFTATESDSEKKVVSGVAWTSPLVANDAIPRNVLQASPASIDLPETAADEVIAIIDGEAVKKLGQAPRSYAKSLLNTDIRSEPVPFFHSLGVEIPVPPPEGGAEDARDADPIDLELTDLLEVIADDVAQLWAEFP